MSELQHIVDDLAERLAAPTVLEDHDERMIVYSSHRQPVDAVRRDSILRRSTSGEVKAWFRRHGIATATAPLRIPGQRDQEILGRLCVPVRFQGRLLGWLFLIDDEQRLGEEGVARARRAAEQAAPLLYEAELTERLASRSLAQLLSPSEDLRDAAARQITDQGIVPAGSPCAVAVIQVLGLPDREARERIGEAIRDAARAVPGQRALWLGNADHGVVLTRASSLQDDGTCLAAARDGLAALRNRVGDVAGARAVAAAGDPQPHLKAACRCYQQARMAARVAAVIPGTGDVARWRDLGAFRVLAQLPRPAADAAVDPRVGALLAAGDTDLVDTLETYLNLGCDAKKASAALHLHRTSLYYRLDKAQRLSGANLRDGDDRLAVHLGLKLARLTGQYPGPRSGRAPDPGAG